MTGCVHCGEYPLWCISPSPDERGVPLCPECHEVFTDIMVSYREVSGE